MRSRFRSNRHCEEAEGRRSNLLAYNVIHPKLGAAPPRQAQLPRKLTPPTRGGAARVLALPGVIASLLQGRLSIARQARPRRLRQHLVKLYGASAACRAYPLERSRGAGTPETRGQKANFGRGQNLPFA